MESENKNIDQHVSTLKDREAELQRQINALSQKMILKDSEIIRANGKIETLQAYANTLEAEVKDSRQRIDSLGNEIHNGQSSNIQQEHKKNQQEIQIFDLVEQLSSQKDEIKQYQEDMVVTQRELNESRQKTTNLVQ